MPLIPFTATILYICALFLVPPANAQMAIPGVACSPRDVVVRKLEDEYKEKQIGIGVVGPEAVLEMWASEEGTFTMIVYTSDGRACVLAAGDQLEIQNFKWGKGA